MNFPAATRSLVCGAFLAFPPAEVHDKRFINFEPGRSQSAIAGVRFGGSDTSVIKDADLALKNFVSEIESFKVAETEDDLPVNANIADAAILLLTNIRTTDNLLPYFLVPTSSGGVVLEYRRNGFTYYYQINPNLRIKYSILDVNNDPAWHHFYNEPSVVPTPSASPYFTA